MAYAADDTPVSPAPTTAIRPRGSLKGPECFGGAWWKMRVVLPFYWRWQSHRLEDYHYE
jgi:hypothetical protein